MSITYQVIISLLFTNWAISNYHVYLDSNTTQKRCN